MKKQIYFLFRIFAIFTFALGTATWAQGYSSSCVIQCPGCNGFKYKRDAISEIACGFCNGIGYYRYDKPILRTPKAGDRTIQQVCPTCHGARFVPGERFGIPLHCARCNGYGYIEESNPQYRTPQVSTRASRVFRHKDGHGNIDELMAELPPHEADLLLKATIALLVRYGNNILPILEGKTAQEIFYLHEIYCN